MNEKPRIVSYDREQAATKSLHGNESNAIVSTSNRVLLLALVIFGSYLPTACAATPPSMRARHYTYRLDINHRPGICRHMERVFNERFDGLWRDDEPLLPNDPNSPYAEKGRYAFAKVAEVEHDERATFALRWSKWPRSAEFDAISWRESRLVAGGPPGVHISSSQRPYPALLAQFDIDNDGSDDTVIKSSFTEGRSAIQNGSANELIGALRSRRIQLPTGASLWELTHTGAQSGRLLTFDAQYARPFIHARRTYIAEYEMRFTDFEHGTVGPYTIADETMKILELSYTGASNELTGAPIWTQNLLCTYQMNLLTQ